MLRKVLVAAFVLGSLASFLVRADGYATQSGAWNVTAILDGGVVGVTQVGVWNVSILDGGSGGSSSNASVGLTGTTTPTSATNIGVTKSGNMIPITEGQAVMNSSLPVAIASDQSALPVTQNGVWNVSLLDAGNPSVLAVGAAAPSYVTAAGIINGSSILDVIKEGQSAMANSLPVTIASNQSTLGVNVAQISGATVTTTSTAGEMKVGAEGIGIAGAPSGGVLSIQGVGGGTAIPISGSITLASTTANQGTANTAANGWPVKITDGTNVVAVKAASTAAVATDPAQVVAISPNNSVAVTQATASSLNATIVASGAAASTATTYATVALPVAQRPTTATNAPSSTTLNGATPVHVVTAAAGICQALVCNNDATIKDYCGETNAVSTSSIPIVAGACYHEGPSYGGDVWCVSASGTPTVSIQVTSCP